MAEQDNVQTAQQMAQTIAEAIRQLGAETTRQVIDATRTASSQEVGAVFSDAIAAAVARGVAEAMHGSKA